MNLLGVDIGGTKIAAGIVDGATGTIVYADRTPTLAHEGGPAILARAIALAQRVTQQAGLPLAAVGIGAGGQIDHRNGIVLSATEILPGWAGTRLAPEFAGAFGVPAFADNDVNAFAQGEYRFGAGIGARDVVFLALGTGVGGALVIDGRLHRGARGTGGEPGHLLLGTLPDSEPATLEYLTCGDALVRNYRLLGGESRPGTEIGVLALQEPASIAGRAAATLGTHLGQGLASLANLLDPERFVIGGGLADLGDRILGPARDALARYALPVFRNVPVLPAALGTRSSLVGAACVALTALEGENIVR